jgi:hypothetical protein
VPNQQTPTDRLTDETIGILIECLEDSALPVTQLRRVCMVKALRELQERRAAVVSHAARPRADWHESMGDVMWWHFPVQEPPHCGSPLDDDWPENFFGSVPEGYYTHWTPFVVPNEPGESHG